MDPNTWTVIFTLVLAAAAVAGFGYTARGYRAIARQTSVAVEAAFPYFRLNDLPPRRVTHELGGSFGPRLDRQHQTQGWILGWP